MRFIVVPTPTCARSGAGAALRGAGELDTVVVPVGRISRRERFSTSASLDLPHPPTPGSRLSDSRVA